MQSMPTSGKLDTFIVPIAHTLRTSGNKLGTVPFGFINHV